MVLITSDRKREICDRLSWPVQTSSIWTTWGMKQEHVAAGLGQLPMLLPV